MITHWQIWDIGRAATAPDRAMRAKAGVRAIVTATRAGLPALYRLR
ncbi:MAG: hypothetical protein H7245_06970 [Candidatus Saccharibacteria bacterium]|nr:hypothetical protein [Pseudorhodobacter sp.]